MTTEAPTALIRRAKPSDIADIVTFLNKVRKDAPKVDASEIMQSFADKGFMVAHINGALVAVVGWHVENLVACLEEVYIYPASLRETVAPQMLKSIETAADQLMAEAALLFVTQQTPKAAQDLYTRCGYKATDPTTLVRAWKEAALNLLKTRPNTKVFFKQLRESRVTRPI